MRKLFFVIIVFNIMLTGCSSEQPLMDSIEYTMDGFPVSINLQSVDESGQLKNTSLSDAGVKQIAYFVYREENKTYLKHRFLTTENIGVIKDTLPEGKYIVAILATTSDEAFDFKSLPNADRSFGNAGYNIRSSGIDCFYKDFVLNVTTGAIQETTVLERITTRLEIVPQDVKAIPANLEEITFYFDNILSQYFGFESKNIITSTDVYPNPSQKSVSFSVTLTRAQLLKVTEENPISIMLFPVESPYGAVSGKGGQVIPIVASCMYTNSSLGQEHIVKRTYTLEQNKVLRLTGDLFTNSFGGDIYVNDEWDTNVKKDTLD